VSPSGVWIPQLGNKERQKNGDKNKVVLFREEVTGTKVTTLKICAMFESQ
jgi:hypothetical protein